MNKIIIVGHFYLKWFIIGALNRYPLKQGVPQLYFLVRKEVLR